MVPGSLPRGYIGIMEKKMVTTITYRGYCGAYSDLRQALYSGESAQPRVFRLKGLRVLGITMAAGT